MNHRHTFCLAAVLALALLTGCHSAPPSPSSPQPPAESSSLSSSASSSASRPEQPDASAPGTSPSPPAPQVIWEGDSMKFQVGVFTLTAENFGEGEGGHSTVLSACTADSPDVPFQTLTTESPADAFGEGCLLVTDANFDGYEDFGWKYLQEGDNCWYHIWLWDEKAGAFTEAPAFPQAADGSGGICSPVFAPDRRTVTGLRRDGTTDSEITLWQWTEGKLTPIRQLLLTGDRLQVLEPVEGELTEIHSVEGPAARQEAVAWEDPGFHG